ncbi:MAG: molybdopterin cofactor-binding domain-containing protein, partial [Pseudomonas marincola]
MTNNKSLKQISRRKFLVNTGWAAAGVTLLSSCQSLLPAFPSTSSPEPEDSLLWVQILPSGEIRFLCPRMEMGQGAAVGLTQIVATELKVDQAHIQCQTPSTNDLPRFKLTVG